MEGFKTQQLADITKTITKSAEINDRIKSIHNKNFVDLCSDFVRSKCYTITDSDDNNDNDDDDVIVVDDVNLKIVKNHANFINNNNGGGQTVTIALRPCPNLRQQNQNTLNVNINKNKDKDQTSETAPSQSDGPLSTGNNDNQQTFEETNDIYCKLVSILKEYEPQIKDVWKRQNDGKNTKRKRIENTDTNPTNDNSPNKIKAKQIRLSNNDKLTVKEPNSKNSKTSQQLYINASTQSISIITTSTNQTMETASVVVEEELVEAAAAAEVEEENVNDISNILIKARSEIIEEPKFTKRVLINYNNDCQMTIMDTLVCALCPSKPKDLTNHYIRRHKTESYISRLPWFKLNNLLNQTNYVNLIECVYGNEYQNRYSLTCPFCNHIVTERFQNFYEHFSMHTGEYAYGCGTCNFRKPFACDIKNHQNQSKLCQMSNIKILYRYPPMATTILLHFCFICNFVQLNEANIAKHLRDHHNDDENLPGNIRNCILASLPPP